jgi:serine/threonine protein kinase
MHRAVADLEVPPDRGGRGSTPRASRRFVTPEPAELAIHLPEFEILDLLGQGGMGAVYRARQRSHDRLVALKLIPAAWNEDPTFVERFQREARTVAKLDHPNVVAGYDSGHLDHYCYFVMEYVDGPNLRDMLESGPLPPGEAFGIVDQMCDALSYAHSLGIVHRDIKPENILLDDEPLIAPPDAGLAGAAARVKIADFGLAKLLEPEPDDFTLTTREHVLGTPQYMAPEQIERPSEVDHRADIYALGVVLYEMLTGELPLGRFEPVSRMADVDRRVDDVVLRCLEKDPDRRYPDAAEVKDELVRIQAIALARSTRRRGSLIATALAGAGLLLAAVSVLAWQIVVRMHDHKPDQIEISSIEPKPNDAEAQGSANDATAPAEDTVATPDDSGDQALPPAEPAADGEAPPAPTGRRGSVLVKVGERIVKDDTASQPEVQLSNARLSSGVLQRSLRIDYRFQIGSPRPGSRYFWIVESADGWVGEVNLIWMRLGREGTLRTTFHPHGASQGPFETYLELEEFGPFSGRRRVSNVVKIGGDPP